MEYFYIFLFKSMQRVADKFGERNMWKYLTYLNITPPLFLFLSKMGSCVQISLAISVFSVKFQKVNFNTSISSRNSQAS